MVSSEYSRMARESKLNLLENAVSADIDAVEDATQ